MARVPSRQERARREGARAALREHLRLGTAMDRPVDIFGIIEKANVWLMFQPMPRLFGAYKREDGTAGIIINSNHPVSLQRYTAAHEYGHHVLHDEGSIDLEESISGFSGRLSEQELAAQTFAADFLMPLQLVNVSLRRIGFPISLTRLSSADVYNLSLQLGASYAATITQLVALRKISPGLAGALRKERPLAVKESLGGTRPTEARSDVWMLGESDSGRQLTPHVKDEIHVLLSETPSSGYVWKIDGPLADAGLERGRESNVELVRDEFEPTESGEEITYGDTGVHRIVFRVAGPGLCNLRFTKTRPWQLNASPSAVFEAHLNALERPTGEADRGLTVRQKGLLSAA